MGKLVDNRSNKRRFERLIYWLKLPNYAKIANILTMKSYLEFFDIFHVRSIDQEMITLGKRVKVIRRKRGYTQTELSDRSGVSLGSLKRFERTGEISLRHLWGIAEALDLGNELTKLFSLASLAPSRREFWGNEDI